MLWRDWKWFCYGCLDPVWTVRGHGDAGLLRAGGEVAALYSWLRGGLCAGLGLRLFAGRLAVRAGGGYLGDCRGRAMDQTSSAGDDLSAPTHFPRGGKCFIGRPLEPPRRYSRSHIFPEP